MVSESCLSQAFEGESLYGSPEKPLCEAVEVKLVLHWRPQHVVRHLPKGEQREWDHSERHAAELEIGNHISSLISGMELQDLEFALLSFGLAWSSIFSLCPQSSYLK